MTTRDQNEFFNGLVASRTRVTDRAAEWFMVWFVIAWSLFCQEAYRQVFRWLGPYRRSETPGAFYRGMKLMVIDGFVVDLPETEKNERAFGRPLCPTSITCCWYCQAVDDETVGESLFGSDGGFGAVWGLRAARVAVF